MDDFSQHASAVVDEGASIGTGTNSWRFCYIIPGAVVGNNCILGQNVFVDNNVKIGNGVKNQNNVSLYNGVEADDAVFLGPSKVFTKFISPRSFIECKAECRKTVMGRAHVSRPM